MEVGSYDYDNTLGISTLTFANNHGLSVFDKIKVSGADSSLYNGDFVISKVNAANKFEVSVGGSSTSPETTGTILVYPYSYSSKGGVNIGKDNERVVSQYAGITTTLNQQVLSTDSSVVINNATTTGLKIGDYIRINREIIRISQTVNGNTLTVFRGLLGTRKETHPSGSIVRKIYPHPVEFRRHSILRASGHTFEYVGFGAGNYSSAFPDRQDRELSEQEELVSQSFKVDGGINVYTGMNDTGDFYIGNKKIGSNGQEGVVDSPIPSVRGEENLSETGNTSSINVINTDNVNVTGSIKVEGGKNSDIVSIFNAPVVFGEKITSNSPRGIEANLLYLQGSAPISRKYTVGISTPTIFGNSGDVEYYSEPTSGGYLGWVYTTDNVWRKFGPIQGSSGEWVGIFSGTFYGDASGMTGLESYWQSTVTGIHTTRGVGIGTNVASSTFNLDVHGRTNINGVLNVGEIIEKITINNSSPSGTVNIDLGDNNVYYFLQAPTSNWNINFRSSSVQNLNSFMSPGQTLTVAILTTQSSTARYNTQVQIDGSNCAVYEYGDLPITEGNASGIDMYTYVIIKKSDTGGVDNRFTVLRSLSQYTQQ